MKTLHIGSLLLTGVFAAACTGAGLGDDEPEGGDHLHSDRGGIGAVAQALESDPITIDPRRSLAVTEVAILSQFSLTEVLNQLATQSNVPGLTGVQMFRQLWDTQNPAPGTGAGPHCNDTIIASQPSLNSFPYGCRPTEGAQANLPSVNITRYSAIGLFNRFDLAPSDGADCGEHRIIFGRTSGGGRNFIIFEAVLPNPQPELGLEGCRPVANFWRDLSTNDDVASRATALRSFYLNGLPGFLPVVHLDNYGNTGLSRPTGQVRTNQFMQSPWMLREFKLQRACGLGGCTARFMPVTDKTNPFGGLFSPTSTHARTAEFQGTFLPSQVARLAVNDINLFNYTVPDRFNTGESVSQAPSINDYSSVFSGTSTLASNIQAELNEIGSALTPANIVARAEALSCGGCHQLSAGVNLGGGLTFPNSAGFVHVTEFPEPGPEGNRFGISQALTDVFLPHRQAVLEGYLNRPEACVHDKCASGVAIAGSCDPCASDICELDPFCCGTEWDDICVEEVMMVCGFSCE
jgi:hypothetical protein